MRPHKRTNKYLNLGISDCRSDILENVKFVGEWKLGFIQPDGWI